MKFPHDPEILTVKRLADQLQALIEAGLGDVEVGFENLGTEFISFVREVLVLSDRDNPDDKTVLLCE